MKVYLFIYNELMQYKVTADSFRQAKLLEEKNPKKYYISYETKKRCCIEYKEVYRIHNGETLKVL